MPLIYNSIESEHQPVQERVLKTVPHLCEILDYGTVQNVLLVKVAVCGTRPARRSGSHADPLHPDSHSQRQGPDAGLLPGYGEDARQGGKPVCKPEWG